MYPYNLYIYHSLDRQHFLRSQGFSLTFVGISISSYSNASVNLNPFILLLKPLISIKRQSYHLLGLFQYEKSVLLAYENTIVKLWICQSDQKFIWWCNIDTFGYVLESLFFSTVKMHNFRKKSVIKIFNYFEFVHIHVYYYLI